MGVPLRRIFRYTWVGVCVLVLLALPVCAVLLHRHHYSLHYLAWFIAGVFVFLTLPISLYDVTQHYEHFTKPKLQRHVARVLWMVPIYSLDSWMALRFPGVGIYFNTARECYEAYVIFNFYMYLIAFLEESGSMDMLEEKEPFPHIWPVNCFLKPWPPGREFLRKCKNGTLNYVVLRPITTLVAFVTEMNGLYGHNELFNPRRAYLYCTLTNNFSQTWALYCLALIYLAYHEELSPMSPFYKFLCVKATVFFSFWQAIGITILLRIGLLSGLSGPYEEEEVADGLQNFVICIEMFFAAMLHAKAFSARQFRDSSFPGRGAWDHLRDMFDVHDVVEEVHCRAQVLRDKLSKKVSFTKRDSDSALQWTQLNSTPKAFKDHEIDEARTSLDRASCNVGAGPPAMASEEEIQLVPLPKHPS